MCLALTYSFEVKSQPHSAKSEAAKIDKLTPFEDEETGLWGYKNGDGKIAIKPQYHIAFDFTGKIAAIGRKDGLYYIDGNGNILNIRPFIYDNGPDYFREGLARFTLATKTGFLNEHGEVVIDPLEFDFVSPFFDSLAVVCIGCAEVKEDEHNEHTSIAGGKWGYVDRQGHLTIPLKFDGAEPFDKGRARVLLNGEWIFVNRTGEVVD